MRFTYSLILILVFSFTTYAEDKIDEGSSEAYILGRLEVMDDIIQNAESPKEKAKLLYEKANLMYEAYKPKVGLRELTECILEAIKLDPDNQEYRDYLKEIYNKEWKHRTFKADTGYSDIMIQLKNKVKLLVSSRK
jgi:hypothetical protein